jgi:hypothetical protein
MSFVLFVSLLVNPVFQAELISYNRSAGPARTRIDDGGEKSGAYLRTRVDIGKFIRLGITLIAIAQSAVWDWESVDGRTADRLSTFSDLPQVSPVQKAEPGDDLWRAI